MMVSTDPSFVVRDTTLLYPELKSRAELALAGLQKDVPGISIFETWRSPDRQNWLYAKGRTAHGSRVTNAIGWASWHQYGLAIDLAVFKDKEWSWDFDRDLVREMFVNVHKLEPGPAFESAHFQLTGGLRIGDAFSMTVEHASEGDHGKERVFEAVTMRLAGSMAK